MAIYRDLRRFLISVFGVLFLSSSTALPLGFFVRGDADSDGALVITDAVRILGFLFEGEEGLECLDAADADDSGRIDITDAVYILEFIFLGGPTQLSGLCGEDSTKDELGCAVQPVCPGMPGDLFDAATAVVLVIDRSETMAEMPLVTAKRVAVYNLFRLYTGGEVGVVFSDVGQVSQPPSRSLLPADDKNKLFLLKFIQDTSEGTGACHQRALMKALEMLRPSDAMEKAIVFLSNGAGFCPGTGDVETYSRETIERVTAANTQGVVINCFSPEFTDDLFLRELAERNGGRYESF